MGSRSKDNRIVPRLLVRLLMQSAQRGGQGSRAEAGYALAVALIAAFVLLLGVAAVASRGQFGFIGQAFQTQNRQARDVAEAAIAEFADTLNREENRFLLIANNSGSDWGNVNNRNLCLAFDDNQNPISGRDPEDPSTLPSISAGVITRFSEGNPLQALRPLDPNLRPLDPNPTARQFRIERIEYLNSTRLGPVDRQSLLSAADRSLIRVTMIGRVDLGNGQTSEARVAREFEVVPKCCNRSYGGNDAVNWGRDREACAITGVSQFRVSLFGGPVNGNGNAISVRDENNDPVTQAVCWNGTDGSDPGNVLTGSVNPNCTKNLLSIPGKPDGTKFLPAKFDYNPPPYASSAPADYLSQVTGNEQPQSALNVLSDATLQMPLQNKDYYIYYEDSINNLRVCRTNKGGGIDTALCFPFPTDSKGNQVCYTRIVQGKGARAPYNEVNCRLRNIVTGNQIIYIDTSKARINFFFDNASYTGELMGGGGNSTFQRVHCRWGQTGYYGGTYNATSRCGQNLLWTDPSGNDFQQKCKTASGVACGLTKSDGSLYNSTYFDASELFNIYSSSPGSFNLYGTASTIGFNLYAPFSNFTIKGGGTADPNFMGRLWVNGFAINGSVSIRLPSSPPSGFDDGLKGALWDFRARSFTQASGF